MLKVKKNQHKKVNLLHIVTCLDFGGLETVVVNLVNGLSKKKYNITIVCLSYGGIRVKEIEELGIEVIILERNKRLDTKVLCRLIEILKKKKIDVIHSHNPSCHFYGIVAKYAGRVPVILNTRHGMGNLPYKKSRELLLGFSSLFTNKVIAVCERAGQQFIKYAHINETKISVIYNGIDWKKCSASVDIRELREQIGLKNSDLIFGTVGRLEAAKDHETLLKAAKEVFNVLPHAKLIIVGNGSLRSNLETLAKNLEISEKIFFLGSRPDAYQIMKVFNAFILPSITEGLSVVLLEAMAGKIPIVATDVGGNAEVLEDQVTGYIVSPGNYHLMAQKIIYLLSNPDLSQQMGKMGFERVKKYFSLDSMVKSYEKTYRKLLAEK